MQEDDDDMTYLLKDKCYGHVSKIIIHMHTYVFIQYNMYLYIV